MAFGPDTRLARGQVAAERVDEGLRAYMLQVYNYMGLGLALTGLIAYFVAATDWYVEIAQTPFIYVLIFAPVLVVFFLIARIHRMSLSTAQLSFWGYAALNGLSLALIFLVYTETSIARVFFITAGMFGAMSLYGYTTKRDLSGWGSFLFMGLIGIFIGFLVNIFLGSTLFMMVLSAAGVIVFTGLTAYDTQQIKEMYYELDASDVAGKKAIMGALRLYLDFINLFIMLLHLFGQRE